MVKESNGHRPNFQHTPYYAKSRFDYLVERRFMALATALF